MKNLITLKEMDYAMSYAIKVLKFKMMWSSGANTSKQVSGV